MCKKIQCETKFNNENKQVRVRVIKAPLVDTIELKRIILARTKAVIL